MSSETAGLSVVFNYRETGLINHLFFSQMGETCLHIKKFYAFSHRPASKSHITNVHLVERRTNYVVVPDSIKTHSEAKGRRTVMTSVVTLISFFSSFSK